MDGESRSVSCCVLLLLWVLAIHAEHYVIQYECLPDGNIVVTNPDLSTFWSMTAGLENGTIFNVTSADDFSSFTVYSVIKDVNVQVTLSPRTSDGSGGDGIIGGVYSETYVLRCDEINSEGIMFTQSLGLNVEPVVMPGPNTTGEEPTYVEPSVSPTFTVVSIMWNSDMSAQVTSANIGDRLLWEIKGPYEYDLLPSCSAFAGPTAGGLTSVEVTNNGCSVIEMLSDFRALSGNATERGDIVSDLWAFKFTSTDELTFACTVKICTRGDAACFSSCSGRRRRYVNKASRELSSLHGSSIHVVSHLIIGNAAGTVNGVSYFSLMSLFVLTWWLDRHIVEPDL